MIHSISEGIAKYNYPVDKNGIAEATTDIDWLVAEAVQDICAVKVAAIEAATSRAVSVPQDNPDAVRWSMGRCAELRNELEELVNGKYGAYLAKPSKDRIPLINNTIVAYVQAHQPKPMEQPKEATTEGEIPQTPTDPATEAKKAYNAVADKQEAKVQGKVAAQQRYRAKKKAEGFVLKGGKWVKPEQTAQTTTP